jgi:hypothetical protein
MKDRNNYDSVDPIEAAAVKENLTNDWKIEWLIDGWIPFTMSFSITCWKEGLLTCGKIEQAFNPK